MKNRRSNIKKVTQKFILLLLTISITLCGCTFRNREELDIEDTMISFTGLDDEKLQNYVMETLYSGINAEFTNDDYRINEITTVYISKEYIEEMEYNSKSNIYFGYDIAELASKFNGKKYVFIVGKDGQTTVEEFKNYEDNYHKMIKNVVVGTGVILVCTTVSIVSGGTVSIIFAASAKTATEFAFSSAALSGIIASAVEYYKTGDIKKALEKGGLEASEGFKWGAILGGITGGANEFVTQAKASKELKTMNFLERGTRSEARAAKKYGGREQVSYFNGKEVSSSMSGATKPDLVRVVDGKLEAIEIKNYNLNNKESRRGLVQELKRQITNRVEHLPKGSTQRIVLDVQGRNYDRKTLNGVIKGIKESCKDVYPDIPVDVMT